MWEFQSERIPSGTRIEIADALGRMSFRQVFEHLEDNLAFSDWYTSLLAAADSTAFFWEHPPFTSDTFDDPAEFVLIDAPSLARLDPDPRPFESHFANVGDVDVVEFENLGRDAHLIVPCPIGPAHAYPHLAAFVRQAPATQVRSLWRHVAVATRERLDRQPIWLSTAGLGVSWLHLRLDSAPKYYNFGPYRNST